MNGNYYTGHLTEYGDVTTRSPYHQKQTAPATISVAVVPGLGLLCTKQFIALDLKGLDSLRIIRSYDTIAGNVQTMSNSSIQFSVVPIHVGRIKLSEWNGLDYFWAP